jgi:hypothetical protein
MFGPEISSRTDRSAAAAGGWVIRRLRLSRSDHDHEEHARRISEIAWANGAHVARWGK